MQVPSIKRVCEHTFLSRYITQASTVIDLGANRGEFSRKLIKEYGCRVYAAEPVPELFKQLPTDSRLAALPLALGGRNGSVELKVFDARCASVFDQLKANEIQRVEQVDLVTFSEFKARLNVNAIDLLKVDIEGAELDMFDATPDEELQAIRQITVEFHDFLYPEMTPRIESLKSRLRGLGFWVIPFSLTNGDVLFVNRKLTKVGWAEYLLLAYGRKYVDGIIRRCRKILYHGLQTQTPSSLRE